MQPPYKYYTHKFQFTESSGFEKRQSRRRSNNNTREK